MDCATESRRILRNQKTTPQGMAGPFQKHQVAALVYRNRGPAGGRPSSLALSPAPRALWLAPSGRPALHPAQAQAQAQPQPRGSLATHRRRRTCPVTQHSAAARERQRGGSAGQSPRGPCGRARGGGVARAPEARPAARSGSQVRGHHLAAGLIPSPCLLLEVDVAVHRPLALQHTHGLGRHDSAARAAVRDPWPSAARVSAGDADAKTAAPRGFYRPVLRASRPEPIGARALSPPPRTAGREWPGATGGGARGRVGHLRVRAAGSLPCGCKTSRTLQLEGENKKIFPLPNVVIWGLQVEKLGK